jgi:Tfp pilus assembly protein PilF
MDQEKFKEANAMVDSALVHFPKEPVFHMHKGLSLTGEEKYDTALTAFRTGLNETTSEEHEKKAEFFLYIADIYATKKVLDSAFVNYEKAYELNPNNALLLNNYAYYLSVANKDLSKAEVMSAKTIQVYPNNISFLDTYAWIFFKQGNMTLAYMYIQQALDKGGEESPVVIEHYGDILFLKGEKEEGVKWWVKSKEKGNKSIILQQKIDTQNYIPEN